MNALSQKKHHAAHAEVPPHDATRIPAEPVGLRPQTLSEADEALTDETREEAIRRAGAAMETAWKRYDEHDDPHGLTRAVGFQKVMYALIRGRSPAQVAKMERERGLN